MSEFRRLREEGDPFERELLASARGDRMSSGARRALVASVTAGAMGGLAATNAAAAATKVAAKAGLFGISKWVAWSIVGSAVIAATVVPVAQSRREAREAKTAATAQAAIEKPREAAVAVSPPIATVEAPAAVPSTAVIATPPRPSAAPTVSARANDASSLSAEVKVIERARAALMSGQARAALAALDEHRAQFPRGVLSEEAAVLRIDAYARLGEMSTATTLARSFLAARPRSMYAARVRRVIGATEGEAQ